MKLDDLGVSKTESSRWQAEAAIPEPVVEVYVQTAKEHGDEITIAGLMRAASDHATETVMREVSGAGRATDAGPPPR